VSSTSVEAVVRTVREDLTPGELGRTLAHEHVFAAFGRAGGDDDLDLVDDAATLVDLQRARADGARTIVDVTTWDMGADVGRADRLTCQAGLRLVKSTGWFRSPSADGAIAGTTVSTLAERLVRDVAEGLDDSGLRAGVLGEVGVSGTAPTSAERAVLDATAEAALATGAGIVLHTDDVENAQMLLSELGARSVPPARMLVGHLRVADPCAWHEQLLAAGCWLGFDQLGHPHRDGPPVVAERVLRLLERGGDGRIVLSADVGRRSRLTSAGGSGYMAGVLDVLDRLQRAGCGGNALERLAGGAAASFLALAAA
jgi:phosphotriesterase-related protein